MTRIFLLGATGYIGGDALYAINQAHPEYEITALVRNSDKAAVVAKEYPAIKFVYGDLNSSQLLEEEAAKADIVAHFADADHEGAATALAKGLAAHPSTKPGFFIHTSGTGILLFEDLRTGTFGEALDKVYDDLEHVSEVTSLPDDAPHRTVDKIVLEVGTKHADKVKTAIVAPPTIYGKGRGPGNQRSVQIPELIAGTLKLGHGFQVGAGKTYWGNVNVHDLSDLYLKLVESAAAGGSVAEWPDKPSLWGAEGYFFCANGEHVWGQVSRKVAAEAKKQGYIKTDEVKSLSKDDANALTPFGFALWGANSRAIAKRARVALKWEPKGANVEDTLKDAVEFEANRLDLKPGHADIAAGNA